MEHSVLKVKLTERMRNNILRFKTQIIKVDSQSRQPVLELGR